MISAGNDVVSLAAIDVTRTNQYKFYSKILSETESPLYNEFSLAQIPFENFVWLLWSIKESAYKFLQRYNPALVFTPVKFVVTDVVLPEDFSLKTFNLPLLEGIGFKDMPSIKSTIQFSDYTLHARSLLYNELIHTVVNPNTDFDNVYWGIKKIEGDDSAIQSAEVRFFLLKRLKNLYGDDNFIIDKNSNGCPVISKNGADRDVMVSLSHHGRFVGYSFYKNGY